MKFDPSTAVLFEEAPAGKPSGFDPTSAVLVEDGEESLGLVARFKEEWKKAVANKKDVAAPNTTNESSFFGFPSIEAPKTKDTGSVMDGVDTREAPAMAGRGAPVRKEVFDATRANYDAATPAQREGLTKRGDWLGSVATAIDDGYKAQPAGLTSVDRIDPRAEMRTARLVGDGVESDTARSIASRSAKAGVIPGDEVSGSAKESNFDFDKANEARGEGQVSRGLEKGYLGLKNQALGIHKFIADTVGADAYGNAMQAGRDKNNRAVDAIGSRSEYLTRNFEGAIESIVSNTPGMLAGFATGSSTIPLVMMGAQVFGDEYATGIEKGQSYADATGRAGLFAAAEVIGEKLAIGDTIKALKSLKGLGTLSNKEVADEFAKHIIRSSLKEIPGEELTTTLQFLTDKIPNFGHNPEAGLSDYLQQVGDTFTATVMQSAMMAGGGRAAIGAHKLMTDRPVSGGQTASDAIDSQRSADLAQQSALDAWASRGLAPSANPVAREPVAPSAVIQEGDGAMSASDLYGQPAEEAQSFPDLGAASIDGAPAELTDIAAPTEMDPEAAAVETTLQRAYGDSPALVDLITSQGGGLGLGGMAETLARVAPKVAAAKDLIESARAARQNAEIAAEQEAIITAEVAQAAAQPPAIEPPAATEQPAPLIQTQQSSTTPIQRRDDLIGAIMRVTGGYGIHPDMAMTLTGDTANKVPKLRGLFTANGQQDMDDLAGMLRESEGFDVADGESLSVMIRDAAAGDVAQSMERTVQDANDATEKQHRDNIRKLAKKFKVKTVGVKFSTVEKIVFETMEARHKAAVQSLDERARVRYDAMLKDALEIVDYDEIDAILTDAHNRFSGREFYLAATRQMRGYIEDVTTERQANNAGQNSETDTETGDPEWLRDGPEGSGSGSDPVAAPEAARSEPPEEEVAPALTLEGQTNAQAAAEFAQEQKRIADEEKARAEKDKAPKVKADQIDLFNTQSSIFDAPAVETPTKPAPGADNKIFTADRAAKARELLRKKLGQLNAGIDPEIVQAGIELAGFHIESGARKFADYSAKMIADIGDVVKPYLKSWYLAVRNYPGFDNAGMESEADLDKAAIRADIETIKAKKAETVKDSLTVQAAPTIGSQEAERGTIGMKLAAGQVVLTASGRKTSPFPKISTDTNRKAVATVKAVDAWLMQNALDEAVSRGDRFNARQFEANLQKPQQADKDSAEEYLFGQQPEVIPSILKPLIDKPKDDPVDQAAHEAATSPNNDLPEPTQAQKEAGNYKVGRITVAGLSISIENPEGSTRSGVDPNGKAWSAEMKSHYGYLTSGKMLRNDLVKPSRVRDIQLTSDAAQAVASSLQLSDLVKVVDVLLSRIEKLQPSLLSRFTYSGLANPNKSGDRSNTLAFADELRSFIEIPRQRDLGGSVDALLQESSSNYLAADSYLFGDSLHTHAARAQRFDYLTADIKSAMVRQMRTAFHDLKVRESIVSLLPVDVVNVLVLGERSSDSRLNNNTMLLERLSIPASFDDSVFVGRLVDAIRSSLPVAFAATVAEKQSALGVGQPVVTDSKGRAASGALNDSSHVVKYSTIGNDKDHLDVFVKPGAAEDYAGPVFVIDQKKANGHFDEHKSMIGWATQDAAVLAYKSNYSKGWDGIASVSPMSMEVFKDWVLSEDKTIKAADWLKSKTLAPAASKAVPLNEIIVQVSVIVEETGEEITLSEKADEALSDVDKRLELARDLLKCLAS